MRVEPTSRPPAHTQSSSVVLLGTAVGLVLALSCSLPSFLALVDRMSGPTKRSSMTPRGNAYQQGTPLRHRGHPALSPISAHGEAAEPIQDASSRTERGTTAISNHTTHVKSGSDLSAAPHNARRSHLLAPIKTLQLKPTPSPLSSSPNFDNITHLPTPIVASHATFNDPPPMTPLVSLEQPEPPSHAAPRNGGGGRYPAMMMHDHLKPPHRVSSEYRPSLVADRSAYKLQQAVGDVPEPDRKRESKRFVSNPEQDDLEATVAGITHESTAEGTSSLEGTLYRGALHRNCYRYVRDIGKGLFSQVVLAEDVETGDPVAIKIIAVPHSSRDEYENFKSYIKRELQILSELRHPGVIELLDYSLTLKMDVFSSEVVSSDEESTSSCKMVQPAQVGSTHDFDSLNDANCHQLMFLKYSPGGNLFEFLLKYYEMETRDRATCVRYWRAIEKMVMELFDVVAYLHRHNVIHRDIKLENILLNYDPDVLLQLSLLENVICLTDFGLSRRVSSRDEMLTTRCGSEDYILPELLMGLSYNGQLTDAWSLGVVTYALLENRLPFDLPPVLAMAASGAGGISPLVLKRQRSRNKTPHRIAMIDWGWFRVVDILRDELVGDEGKAIIRRLKGLVEALLVRKQNRPTVLEVTAGHERL